MSSQPLLSIVIPTKNRQRFCLSAVKSILNLKDERFQVVVQDNSDESSLKEQLPLNLPENLLKYRYHKQAVSFVNNFNMAIDNADGEYICIIGDDDGINPEIIDAAEWAKRHNVECLTGGISASYRWDNVGDRKKFFIKLPASSLMLTKFTGTAKKVDLDKSLNALVENGCASYGVADFPKLYHGLVRKDALTELKNRTGSYLKGLSPDIYAAVALACTVKTLVTIDYPLTIPGVCAASGSIIEGEKKQNSNDLSTAPHFKGRTEPYTWEKNVPEIYCVQTIWADSAFAALREFERYELIENFDDLALAANIIQAEPHLLQDVENYLISRHSQLTNYEIKKTIKKAINQKNSFKKFNANIIRVKRALRLEEFKIIDKLNNMEEATEELSKYLAQSKIDFLNILDEFSKKITEYS